MSEWIAMLASFSYSTLAMLYLPYSLFYIPYNRVFSSQTKSAPSRPINHVPAKMLDLVLAKILPIVLLWCHDFIDKR